MTAARSDNRTMTVFLIAWIALFLGAGAFHGEVLTALARAAAGIAPQVLVIAAWLPLGLIVLLSSLGAVRAGRRRPGGLAAGPGWARVVAAVCALVMAVQVPAGFGGRGADSQAHQDAADTVSGGAIVTGTWWVYGTVLVGAGLLLGVLWLIGKVRRQGPGATEPRLIVHGCLAASLAGLAGALWSVSSS